MFGASTPKQRLRRHPQCHSYDAYVVEAHIADAAFDPRDVGPMQARLEGQVLLRHAAFLAQPLDVRRKDLSELHAQEPMRM